MVPSWKWEKIWSCYLFDMNNSLVHVTVTKFLIELVDRIGHVIFFPQDYSVIQVLTLQVHTIHLNTTDRDLGWYWNPFSTKLPIESRQPPAARISAPEILTRPRGSSFCTWGEGASCGGAGVVSGHTLQHALSTRRASDSAQARRGHSVREHFTVRLALCGNNI